MRIMTVNYKYCNFLVVHFIQGISQFLFLSNFWDYKIHRDEIHTKLVQIMRERLFVHLQEVGYFQRVLTSFILFCELLLTSNWKFLNFFPYILPALGGVISIDLFRYCNIWRNFFPLETPVKSVPIE